MSDQARSLPIRSEADGSDQRVHVKVVDGLLPSQRMKVDTDGNAHFEMHGNDPSNIDKVILTSETGAITTDGVYNASTNTVPSTVGLVTHTRSATPSVATQNKRPTSVSGSANRECLDVAIADESGVPFSSTNPLPITIVDSEGTEVNSHSVGVAVAAAASYNNTYTAIGTFILTGWQASSSGKIKGELGIETGVGTGIFNNYFVEFNSVANPQIGRDLKEPIRVLAGIKVRIKATNTEFSDAQDIYSTIYGHEE